MRIKSDVEFVKRECERIWMSEMADYCGQEVISYNVDRDGDYVCHFSNGGNWAYPPSCIEGITTLEKGKKYYVSGLEPLFEFVEYSENYAIFKTSSGHLRTFEKEHNNFVEHANNVPNFMKVKWEIEKNSIENKVHIICGGIPVAVFSKEGFTLNKFSSPSSI